MSNAEESDISMDLKQIDVELSTQKEKKKPKGNNLLSTGVNDTISLSSMA